LNYSHKEGINESMYPWENRDLHVHMRDERSVAVDVNLYTGSTDVVAADSKRTSVTVHT
jgi:hypothetical protein